MFPYLARNFSYCKKIRTTFPSKNPNPKLNTEGVIFLLKEYETQNGNAENPIDASSFGWLKITFIKMLELFNARRLQLYKSGHGKYFQTNAFY